MTTFTWLHISDLHWRDQETKNYWNSIESAFYDDLKDRLNNLELDAVFFTGDLVTRGEKKYFDSFNERCLTYMREQFQGIQGKEPVFLAVPGNHDLKRPKERNPVFLAFKNFWEDETYKYKNDVWNKKINSKMWKLVSSSFKAYENWWQDKSRPFPMSDNMRPGLLPGDFYCTIEKDGLKIGVTGLNTAMRHLMDDQQGQLELNAAQMAHLFPNTNPVAYFQQNPINLLLTHHPRSWLNSQGLEDYNRDIAPGNRFLLHLCGHLHESGYTANPENFTDQKQRQLQANALFSKENYFEIRGVEKTRKTDRRHGYILGSVTVHEYHHQVTLWPRIYNTCRNEFTTDTDIADKNKMTAEFEIPVIKQRKISTEPDEKAVIHVAERINQCLKRQNMTQFNICLRDVLIKERQVKVNDETPDLGKCLTGIIDIPKIIDLLSKTGQDCIIEHRRTETDVTLVWNDIKEILGWLLILNIDSGWLGRQKDSDKATVEFFTIPAKTSVGVASVFAGIKGTFPKLDSRKGFFDIHSEGAIEFDLPGESGIETGFMPDDQLNEIKTALYRHLGLPEYKLPKQFAKRDDTYLNNHLEAFNRRDGHIYLQLRRMDKSIVEIIGKLRSQIPALAILNCSFSTDEEIFIYPEDDISDKVEAFFRIKP